MTRTQDTSPKPDIAALKKETALVTGVQFALLLILVQLADAIGFAGALPALIGAVFVFLPVFVLDRRGKPYRRYGMTAENPLRQLPIVAAMILVTWPPIVAAVFLFPQMWQLKTAHWQWQLPPGYASVALAHFLVVALPEEFFFRGYLLGRLNEIFTGRFSVLGARVGHGLWISSAIFSLGHFAVDFHPARLLVFFPSLAFGYLQIKRNSIVAPILFHGACNVFMDLFRAGLGL